MVKMMTSGDVVFVKSRIREELLIITRIQQKQEAVRLLLTCETRNKHSIKQKQQAHITED